MEPGNAAGAALNPWRSIWWQPQATIKDIVSGDPRSYVLLLAAVAGIYTAVSLRLFPTLPWFAMVVMALLIGPLLGILLLYVKGALTAWTGRILGGRANQQTLRAAIAWSSIPDLIALPVLFGSIVVFRQEFLRLHAGLTSINAPLVAIALILLALLLWGLFLLVRTIGAVQDFGVIRSIVNVLIPMLVVSAAPVLFRTVLFQPFYMPWGSMKETLLVGDYLVVSKLSYGYSRYSFYGLIPFAGRIFPAEPQRGDIVVFKLPSDNSTDYTQRVIGLPGDEIIMRGGVLFINGKEVPRRRVADFVTQEDGGPPRAIPAYEETLPNGVKYTVLDAEPNGPFDNVGPYKVPEGRYFMLGDNRDNSTDSRASLGVGYVPFENLIGRVLTNFHLGLSEAAIPRKAVTVAPYQAGGFSWGPVIRPMNDPYLTSIAVDPTDDSLWYVGGPNGLYMTKNSGLTWTDPLRGRVGALLVVPGAPQLVYVGVANRLYLSRDKGENWNVIGTFKQKQTIRSVLVAGSRLYVGLHWSTHAEPSGVFVSNLGGASWQFQAFGPEHTGLIVWTLARDPQDGTLYAGTEIFDHPGRSTQSYHPPFFRSLDGGVTWTNVAGTLPWHVPAAAVRPNDGFVYALTEGAGLFGSADKGTTWQPLATGPGLSLLMDPKLPKRLFGGRVKDGALNGGIFVSVDAGNVFEPIGLLGATVAGLAVNGTSTRLFATTYGAGIYVSPIPANSDAR